MEEVNDSVAKKPKGLWPGERMFANDPKYWVIAGVIWLLGWALLSALLWKISAPVTVSYVLAFLTWLLLCAQVVKEKEMAKPVLFGVIAKKISYGLVLVLHPFEKLIRFPTEVRQISLNKAGIQTKAEEQDKERVPRIVLPVEPVVNFRWSSDDDDLTESIKNAPSPDDEEALKNIFEEPILDVIRTVGGQETYLWVLQNRTVFADKVNQELDVKTKESSDNLNIKEKALVKLIRLARLRDITVSFKHMDMPEELKAQQEAEAAAIHKGEAAKIITIKQGEGTARAEAVVRTAILDVLVDEKYKNIAVMLEQMRALVAASQAGKATYVIPADILTALGSALGGAPERTLGMSREQLKVFATPILEQLLKEQLLKQGKGG